MDETNPNTTGTDRSNNGADNNNGTGITFTPLPVTNTITGTFWYPAVATPSRPSWECVRCHRINAPHIDSCTCVQSFTPSIYPTYYPNYPYHPPDWPYISSTYATYTTGGCASAAGPGITGGTIPSA